MLGLDILPESFQTPYTEDQVSNVTVKFQALVSWHIQVMYELVSW
jgi:hypothetical protein